jgi:hypothetical protein
MPPNACPTAAELVVTVSAARGLALLVVLDALAPAERLALVLHDTFAVPFDEIALSWAAPRPRRGNSPAARAAGCGLRLRCPTPIWPASERWSTRSSPPRAMVISPRYRRCSTRM